MKVEDLMRLDRRWNVHGGVRFVCVECQKGRDEHIRERRKTKKYKST